MIRIYVWVKPGAVGGAGEGVEGPRLVSNAKFACDQRVHFAALPPFSSSVSQPPAPLLALELCNNSEGQRETHPQTTPRLPFGFLSSCCREARAQRRFNSSKVSAGGIRADVDKFPLQQVLLLKKKLRRGSSREPFLSACACVCVHARVRASESLSLSLSLRHTLPRALSFVPSPRCSRLSSHFPAQQGKEGWSRRATRRGRWALRGNLSEAAESDEAQREKPKREVTGGTT